MLQRAASNAYSWWWASHIRTKQSKWLEQNLQDMEEKVQYMVKLIEEDGDSFAKRAEMYYKKRPELINFVEESYRAYRALAERFDHISKELQNANSALAAAFPDQYQFGIDDDDEYSSPRTAKRMPGGGQNLNVPKVPKFPAKNIKAIMALTKKKTLKAGSHARCVPKSGLSKDEALDEIDKLQKVILTKQTEKEFTKSSYESGVQKYWQMEEEITEMQEKISKLQDEFGIGKVIEDDEARNLMAEAALKSCQDTLVQLQEKQEKTAVQAKAEHERIKNARDKLLALRKEFHGDQNSSSQATSANVENSFMDEEKWIPFDEPQETSGQVKQLEELRDKVKEEFKDDSGLTVTEMAEKIDKLVSKVINLETAVSSQTALIQRLRSETDGLQEQIKTLEDDKANLIDGKNTLTDKLAAMENRLKGLQNLTNSFESQKNQLKSQFTKAQLNIEQLSDKLPSLKPDEETEVPQQGQDSKIEVVKKEVKEQQTTTMPEAEDQTDRTAQVQQSAAKPDTDSSSHEIDSSKPASQDVEHPEVPHQPKYFPSTASIQPQVQSSQPEDEPSTTSQPLVEAGQTANKSAPLTTQTHVKANQKTDELPIPGTQPQVEANQQTHAPASLGNTQPQEQAGQQQEGEPNWQQMFMKGLEGKEKVLLAEYTSILRSYKEVKKKLGEIESQGHGDVSEVTEQIREMKISNAKKDEEIQSLRQKLIALQRKLEEYKNEKEIEHTEADAKSTERSIEKDDDLINVVKDLHIISPIEQKFREGIDEILEENLDFWMRFSTSFQQIQKFQNSFEDLQKELTKIEENNQQQEGSSTAGTSLKSETRPIYKHMREIENELSVWVEHSQRLKEELQRRFTQLCNIQEDITHALNTGAEDDEMKFTSFQAAKFQGEVLNMQQENNKVADELQAGLDHITSLQVEVERTITRLNEELGFSGSRSQNSPMRSGSKARVPLRSFIFGVKPQKKKQSIFSCMHPGLHRKYHHLRTGDSL